MEKSELNHLFQENYKKIFLLTLKMLKNYEDAEDTTQEIFMKAYQNVGKFRHESKFSTWLYRIALNHIYNFKNNEKRHPKPNMNEMHSIATESPEIVLKEKELNKKLREAIDSLPPRQKEIFVLRHYDGLPFKEIAKIFKRSLGATKSNYFFAMQKIKKELQKSNLLKIDI